MIQTDDQLLLSVVIPVFNRQESFNALMEDLSRAIISCGSERLIEVIVIDDCSTIPVRLSDFPCQIKLDRNQSNSGAPFSRKKGFQMSMASFVHFHDSDDTITENWLPEMLQELSSKPDTDILITGRIDHDNNGITHKRQKFINRQVLRSDRILSRLTYWNFIGPMGGVTFSRRVLETIKIKQLSSCQDWQMYLDAIENAKVIRCRPDIQFLFQKTGNDRISQDARKKLLGHLQLSKQTARNSIFKRHIRLFYLYACKQHIYKKGGYILKFYKNNRFKIIATYLVVSVYSFLPRI